MKESPQFQALVLEDNPSWQMELRRALTDAGLHVAGVFPSIAQLLAYSGSSPHLITLDGTVVPEGEYGEKVLASLEQIVAQFPHALLVFISNDSSSLEEATAVGIPLVFDKSRFDNEVLSETIAQHFVDSAKRTATAV